MCCVIGLEEISTIFIVSTRGGFNIDLKKGTCPQNVFPYTSKCFLRSGYVANVLMI